MQILTLPSRLEGELNCFLERQEEKPGFFCKSGVFTEDQFAGCLRVGDHTDRLLADAVDVALLIGPCAILDVAEEALALLGAKAVCNLEAAGARGDLVGELVVAPLVAVEQVEEDAGLGICHPLADLVLRDRVEVVPLDLELLVVLAVELAESLGNTGVVSARGGGASPGGKGALLHVDLGELVDALHQRVGTAVVVIDLAELSSTLSGVDARLGPGAGIVPDSHVASKSNIHSNCKTSKSNGCRISTKLQSFTIYRSRNYSIYNFSIR